MEVLSQRVEQRRANFTFYQNALKGIPGISFVNEPEGYYSNRWLTTILIEPEKTSGVTREGIRLALEKENKKRSKVFVETDRICNRYLKIFLIMEKKFQKDYLKRVCVYLQGSNLTEEDLERVVECVRGMVNGEL